MDNVSIRAIGINRGQSRLTIGADLHTRRQPGFVVPRPYATDRRDSALLVGTIANLQRYAAYITEIKLVDRRHIDVFHDARLTWQHVLACAIAAGRDLGMTCGEVRTGTFSS